MELKSNLRILSYTKKLLQGETEHLLPFPVQVQKPVFQGRMPQRLARISPQEAQVDTKILSQFLKELQQNREGFAHNLLCATPSGVFCEASWEPYTLKQWHVTHSLCKSFTGTAIGMLADEGLLDFRELVCDIFPEKCSFLTSRKMRSVTVHHLLSMTSGVNFKEMGAVCSSDWLKSFLESDFLFEPGSKFDYNSMNTYVLSAIVKHKSGFGLVEYLKPRLFDPLGFGEVAWETCPSGIEKGGWGMYVFAEDAAKLGLLYLQEGLWHTPKGTKRILSKDWVCTAMKAQAMSTQEEEYGYQLWPDTAHSMTMFNGMFGQYVFMAADLNLVVVLQSGAQNLFTRSESYHTVTRFFDALRKAPRTAGTSNAAPAPYRTHFLAPPYSEQQKKKPRTLREKIWHTFFSSTPATVDTACTLLEGRHFTFERNQAGLLPRIIAVMNDFYSGGVQSISFSCQAETLVLSWVENGVVGKIPLGFERPLPFVLDAGGNRFEAACFAQLCSDEDDRAVLKMHIYLTESSSCRQLKLFLPFDEKDDVLLCFYETPGLVPMMLSLAQLAGLGHQTDALFRDMDYLRYRLERFSSPVVHGKLEPKRRKNSRQS